MFNDYVWGVTTACWDNTQIAQGVCCFPADVKLCSPEEVHQQRSHLTSKYQFLMLETARCYI